MAAGLTFAWGVRDCATLAADHVLALTGRDPMADLRGLYASPRAAARVLDRFGGLVEAVDALIGWPRVAPSAAEVAALPTDRSPVLAVRSGQWWEFPAPCGVGIVRADLVAPLACWGPA